MTRPRWRMVAWRSTIVVGLATLGSLTAVWVSWELLPEAPSEPGRPAAVWAGHRWVGQLHSPREYARLADLLAEHRISDVFFHVGPLDADGTIPAARYRHAATLLHHLQAHRPGPRLQAWVGQIEARRGGPLDLSRPAVRAAIAQTGSELLELGFGGIHYDIEPILPGDVHYLDLLQRTRALTRARGAVLSVAAPAIEPVPGMQTAGRRLVGRVAFWTASYYRAVSDHVDQIAVMSYATGLPTDWLYGTFTRSQTHTVARAVGGRVTVFMGVPTYQQRAWNFHPQAENIRSGLRGIEQAAARLPSGQRRYLGVALYADWTTSTAEWATFRTVWLDP